MSNSILLISGSYHFGDNPGAFQNATYVGYQLVLPVRKIWLDERAEKLTFHFTTHDVETWGDWKGHKVSINGTEIGRIKEAGQAGASEITKLSLRRCEFVELLDGKDNFNLGIELEKQPAYPRLADDFVLTRIATSDNLALVLGWKKLFAR
jgi:hypothetical protein